MQFLSGKFAVRWLSSFSLIILQRSTNWKWTSTRAPTCVGRRAKSTTGDRSKLSGRKVHLRVQFRVRDKKKKKKEKKKRKESRSRGPLWILISRRGWGRRSVWARDNDRQNGFTLDFFINSDWRVSLKELIPLWWSSPNDKGKFIWRSMGFFG